MAALAGHFWARVEVKGPRGVNRDSCHRLATTDKTEEEWYVGDDCRLSRKELYGLSYA